MVIVEIFEITPNQIGLFQDRYKLSWLAFRPDNPDERVLIDAHPPFGIHYHVDKGEQVPINLKSMAEALKFFEEQVVARFGVLEENFYEDIHI